MDFGNNVCTMQATISHSLGVVLPWQFPVRPLPHIDEWRSVARRTQWSHVDRWNCGVFDQHLQNPPLTIPFKLYFFQCYLCSAVHFRFHLRVCIAWPQASHIERPGKNGLQFARNFQSQDKLCLVHRFGVPNGSFIHKFCWHFSCFISICPDPAVYNR